MVESPLHLEVSGVYTVMNGGFVVKTGKDSCTNASIHQKGGFASSRNGQNDPMWRQNGDMASEGKTIIFRAQYCPPIWTRTGLA